MRRSDFVVRGIVALKNQFLSWRLAIVTGDLYRSGGELVAPTERERDGRVFLSTRPQHGVGSARVNIDAPRGAICYQSVICISIYFIDDIARGRRFTAITEDIAASVEVDRRAGDIEYIRVSLDQRRRDHRGGGDVAGPDLQRPVAAQGCGTGQVVGRRDNRAGTDRQILDQGRAVRAGTDVASIQHNVGARGQARADLGEQRRFGGGGRGIEPKAAETDRGLTAMGKQVQRGDTRTALQHVGHLRQPVLRGIQDMDLRARCQPGEQHIQVGHIAFDKHDRVARLRRGLQAQRRRFRRRCDGRSRTWIAGAYGQHGIVGYEARKIGRAEYITSLVDAQHGHCRLFWKVGFFYFPVVF